MKVNLAVHTIGHSTRSIEEFIELLQGHGVKLLADVRTIPKSRRVPQFNGDILPPSLEAAGIHYVHMKKLGGLRHPRKDSPNIGWRNEGFRGYADYMATEEFRTALSELVEAARESPTAIMCAEAVPWRCHRSLVADALVVLHGATVRHIMSLTRADTHKLTPFLEHRGDTLLYAGTEQPDLPGM